MGFKEVVYQENQRLGKLMDEAQVQSLYQRSKYYILMQEIKAKLTPQLPADEPILAYLPLTNTDNTALMNTGINGPAYARSKAAREYVEKFHDTRGNRLMVFTKRQILFLVVVDFLEDNQYFSYPYSSLQSIFVEKYQRNYFDEKFRRQRFTCYFVDFQSEAHVFIEALSEQDYQEFCRIKEQISAFAAVPKSNHVQRNSRLDRILHKIGATAVWWINIPFFLLLVYLIWRLLSVK